MFYIERYFQGNWHIIFSSDNPMTAASIATGIKYATLARWIKKGYETEPVYRRYF